MFLRIFSALTVAAALSGCGGNISQEPEGTIVECAIGPGAEYSSVCTFELIADDEFVIHHPDGGFRRFVFNDAGLLSASDGAEPVLEERINVEAGIWEFQLNIDRYRMDSGLKPRFAGE